MKNIKKGEIIVKEIVCYTYDSWSQFKENVYRDLYHEKVIFEKYVYRGQPNATYSLVSTFDRYFPHILPSEKKKVSYDLLRLFKEECDYNLLEINSLNEMSLMAFARHHGLPTRLLDWSKSIYVAAFFAYTGQLNSDYGEDVSIYALNMDSPIVNEESGLNLFIPMAGFNKRQFYQQGLYTYLNTYHNSIDDYVTDSIGRFQFEEPTLYKLILPASGQKEALTDLQFMNINYSILLGDADGYSKNALLKYKLSN